MVEGKPNTPTVVIKGNWKRNGYHKKRNQYELIVSIYDREGSQIGEQDCQLGGDYIDQDGSDKEPLFALEDNPTRGAVLLYSKWPLNDGRLSTDRTPELKTPAQKIGKRRAISPHE